MDKPKWKAGDTCQIKPKTAGVPAYQCGALWTVAHVKPNGEVGVHNGVPGNTEFFGMTIFITLSPSRLLPAGDARPMVAAEMGSEVLRLRARVAELEATLANECGEGEPPATGWEWDADEGEWLHGNMGSQIVVCRTAKGWTWDADRVSSGYPHFNTARDAMRAASSQGADVPKGHE